MCACVICQSAVVMPTASDRLTKPLQVSGQVLRFHHRIRITGFQLSDSQCLEIPVINRGKENQGKITVGKFKTFRTITQLVVGP